MEGLFCPCQGHDRKSNWISAVYSTRIEFIGDISDISAVSRKNQLESFEFQVMVERMTDDFVHKLLRKQA